MTVNTRIRSAASAQPRILLVDDDSNARAAVFAALSAATPRRAEIREASDGREAMDVAHRIRPSVVVCDSSMKHGEKLGERLRSLLPESRIISFSGMDADRPWADEVIQKGSERDLERLERAVFSD